MTPHATHAVLIPSYNTGEQLRRTVDAVRAHWAPVYVVVDGSSDGSADFLAAEAASDQSLRVLTLPENRGKGAAVLAALAAAAAAGLTHALVFDADGQHPADHIAPFMHASLANPAAAILGVPVFADSAPALRVQGRRVSNGFARLETGGAVADSLFGFRVYPIAPLSRIMRRTRWMRRFDFDPEAAVRLCWEAVPIINLPAPVRYLAASEGGVSHFRYGRDNVLLTFMHTRLVLHFIGRRLRAPLVKRDAVKAAGG